MPPANQNLYLTPGSRLTECQVQKVDNSLSENGSTTSSQLVSSPVAMTIGNNMPWDTAAFEQKMAQLLAVLPSLGQFIQAAEVIAPKASGLTKAGLVINTMVAAEPLLVGTEQMLSTAVTGIVTAYRSAGTLPTPAPAAVSTEPAPAAVAAEPAPAAVAAEPAPAAVAAEPAPAA